MTTTKNELFSGLEHEHFYLVGRLTFDGGNKHLLVGGGGGRGCLLGRIFIGGKLSKFLAGRRFFG